jgi:hypothetical protein
MSGPKPFNLSKYAQKKDPPRAFQAPVDRGDPYRRKKGPGSGEGHDLLRPGDQGMADQSPDMSAGQFENDPNWPPTDQTFLTDDEGHPKRENGTGLVTDYGLDLHDSKEPSSVDAVLGRNSTVTRMMDNDRDRPTPFNNMSQKSVYDQVRRRQQ